MPISSIPSSKTNVTAPFNKIKEQDMTSTLRFVLVCKALCFLCETLKRNQGMNFHTLQDQVQEGYDSVAKDKRKQAYATVTTSIATGAVFLAATVWKNTALETLAKTVVPNIQQISQTGLQSFEEKHRGNIAIYSTQKDNTTQTKSLTENQIRQIQEIAKSILQSEQSQAQNLPTT